MQSNFWAGTKHLEQHKKNLGPVKGQGISVMPTQTFFPVFNSITY